MRTRMRTCTASIAVHAQVIRETWDDYVLEYCHRVKDFARFTRSIGDCQMKDAECAHKFNQLQKQASAQPPRRLSDPRI